MKSPESIFQNVKRRAFTALALRGIDVWKSGEELNLRLWPDRARDFLVRIGSFLAAGILIGLSFLFLRSLAAFPYYSPLSNVEELTLYYTSAGNFLKYGFMNSGLLQDLSTSSNPADHPYTYNHMPPGPDILIALLLKASGGAYRLVRFIFWLTFLAGMICFFRFTSLIFERLGLTGGSYAIVLLNPLLLLRTMDDPLYAPFPLFAFLPLLLLLGYYRTGSRWSCYLSLFLGLVAAVYLDYLSMFVVVYCWVFLWLTQLVRLDRIHLFCFLGVVFLGVLLHLFQNFLYLGPDLFFRELGMTLGNRVFGFPSKEDMKAFYQAKGMVHHGSQPVSIPGLLYNLSAGLAFPGRLPVVLATGAALAWCVLREARPHGEPTAVAITPGEATAALGNFVKLVAWVSGTLIFPMLMFPAFTQEYGLHGTGINLYFVAIGGSAGILFALTQVVGPLPRRFLTTPAGTWLPVIPILLLVLTGVSVWRIVHWNLGQFRIAVADFQAFVLGNLEDVRRRFGGQVYMTNINPVTIGFFAQEAGHGVCELTSLPEEGGIDVTKCHVSYMRRGDYYRRVRPRYYFFVRGIYPGFSDCLPSALLPSQRRGGDDCVMRLEARLSARFKRVYDNGLFSVFDLQGDLPS